MVARRLALAIGLLFALVGAQWPEFSQQYRQRLGGALDELTRVVAAFDDEAASHDLTPDQAIARLKDNPEALARERGADIEGDIARQGRLQADLAGLQNAGPLRRLAVIVGDLDPAIASQTLRDFEPALPMTSETLTVAGLALVLGWGATHLVAWPIRRRWRPRVIRQRIDPPRGQSRA
jgi:hypothetical protein